MKSDIGMIGLAVMGENLSLNLESKGYKVSVFNIETDWVEKFINNRGKNKNFYGAMSFESLVQSLKKPRIIMMMIRSGEPVDMTINSLLPYLDKGDILIDGGNSHFSDTARRVEYLKSKGISFIGTGVSGGEDGALNGPSLMPGGDKDAWKYVEPIFTAISAKTIDGESCSCWVGDSGAGHFVKTVHNGIEYGDMQLICESYMLMKDYLSMSNDEIKEVFNEWNKSELSSYLIEITVEILGHCENGEYTVDKILDVAGQKGTGKWASIAALDEGVALTLINEAVYARCLSAIKEQRVKARIVHNEERGKFSGDKHEFIDAIKHALYASKIVSYAQGFALMKSASERYGWNLDYGKVALSWRGGCIIRSVFLSEIKKAFDRNPNLENLMLDNYFVEIFNKNAKAWRNVVSQAVLNGYSVPAMSSALGYFDGYRSERLPINLLQAQRDYFGAHTYERIDKERGQMFHTDWTGKSKGAKSSVYNV